MEVRRVPITGGEGTEWEEHRENLGVLEAVCVFIYVVNTLGIRT